LGSETIARREVARSCLLDDLQKLLFQHISGFQFGIAGMSDVSLTLKVDQPGSSSKAQLEPYSSSACFKAAQATSKNEDREFPRLVIPQ
jgi:hypothetical protein